MVPAERVELPTHALRNIRKLCIRAQLRALAHIKSSTWTKMIVRRCSPMRAVVYAHYGVAMAQTTNQPAWLVTWSITNGIRGIQKSPLPGQPLLSALNTQTTGPLRPRLGEIQFKRCLGLHPDQCQAVIVN